MREDLQFKTNQEDVKSILENYIHTENFNAKMGEISNHFDKVDLDIKKNIVSEPNFVTIQSRA